MMSAKINFAAKSRFGKRIFGAAAVGMFGSLALAGAPKVQATTYDFAALGFLPGGFSSYATGINDSDEIVGYSQTSSQIYYYGYAFSYTQAGGMTDLGTLGGTYSLAYGINDSGTIVGVSGQAINNQARAFSDNGTMTNLGLLPNYGTETSNATAINESGTIVGSSGYEPPETSESYRAFSYSAGTMTNLGTLAVGGYSHAYGVNNSGTVVGWASVSYGVNQAFSYTSSEGMKNLGSLPGGASSAAYGINDSSTVVGYSNASSGYNHAFSYSDGTMTDLGILPGYVNSYALGINDSGTIVGDASTQYGNASHAIIYSDGAWSDLNNPTLTLNLPSGWLMEEATAINASGDIVGYGQNASELDEAFLLTPTPEPGSLALLAVGGIGLLIRRRNNRR